MKRTVLLAVLALLTLSVAAEAANYTIDKTHSAVTFKVKHMMVSNVRGAFTDFEGSFSFDADAPENSSAQVDIQVASVNTADEKRDEHLRSPEFFDAATHPVMSFKSTKLVSDGDNEYTLYGDLTLHGVTRPVELELEFIGTVNDPWGNVRSGFEAEGEINRKDFDINFSKTLDGGGLMVGDKVKIELEIEGILQK
ncbi:MAG: YceI family protein [Gammaproteobacteria bacterium]|nr:YceI family protein [Gammaproteobacteria bacterium]